MRKKLYVKVNRFTQLLEDRRFVTQFTILMDPLTLSERILGDFTVDEDKERNNLERLQVTTNLEPFFIYI